MPSILVVGATGNTGGGVLQHLASVLPYNNLFSKHRLIGLTRNKEGSTAKELAKLPNVEMMEKDWVLIDAEWLRSHDVKRIFMASAVGPSQFQDESLFLNAALSAGVEYVVRISTTVCNVSPNTPVFYGRNHWAIETMLGQPEFNSMAWTSLQPNVFTAQFIPQFEAWLKTYREKGEKTPFGYMLDADHGVAIIDPVEVGIIAGHLLAEENISGHSGKKYILVGPEDATGKEVIKVLEKHAGTTVDDVRFKDQSFLEFARKGGMPETVLQSLGKAPQASWTGGSSIKATPTSPEVMKLYAPKHSFLNMLDEALAKV